MNEYLKLLEEAQQKRIRLTKEQVKSIRNLFWYVVKDLEKSMLLSICFPRYLSSHYKSL